jgi:hypothetical protein
MACGEINQNLNALVSGPGDELFFELLIRPSHESIGGFGSSLTPYYRLSLRFGLISSVPIAAIAPTYPPFLPLDEPKYKAHDRDG